MGERIIMIGNSKKILVVGIIFLFFGTTISPITAMVGPERDNNPVKDNMIIQSYSDNSENYNDETKGINNDQNDFIDISVKNYKSSESNEKDETSDSEILSVNYDEELFILEDGTANIVSKVEVPPSELSEMYKNLYGVPDDIAVGKKLNLPEESIMTEKDGELSFSQTKDTYYKSFTEEHMYSLGACTEPYESSMIPRTKDQSFLMTTVSEAYLNIIDVTDDEWTIHIGTSNDPDSGGSFEYLISLVSYAKLLLDSIEGKQVFKRVWSTRIHLPTDAQLSNREDIAGKHWTVDLFHGTYMSATVSIISDSTIIMEETLVVTESEEINPTYFGDYKSFDLCYNLPNSSDDLKGGKAPMGLEKGERLSLDWDELTLFDKHFLFPLKYEYVEADIDIHFKVNCSGKITSSQAWVEVNLLAEVTATISFVAAYEGAIDPKDLWSDFKLVNIQAGPVPIVIMITYGVEFGFDYGVELRSTAEAYAFARATIKLGAKYDWWDGWDKIWDFDFTCGVTPPKLTDFLDDVTLTVWGKPWIGFPVSARIYGLIGPEVEPKIYVLISVGIEVSLLSGDLETFWSIILGFSVDVNVVVGIYKVWEERWGFEILNIEIWEWNSDTYNPNEMPPELDEDPPITTITLCSPPMLDIDGEIWTGRTATFSITAEDFGDIPSGLGKYGTEYYAGRFNDTSIPTTKWNYDWGVINTTTYPEETTPGYYSYYIRAYSVDNNTNIEEAWRKKEINVDLISPTSSASYSTPVYAYETPVRLSSSDATVNPYFEGTGSKITYRLGDGTEENWTEWIVGEWDTNVVLYFSKAEKVEIEWFASDGVWNNQEIQNVTIDVQPSDWSTYLPYDLFSTDGSSELEWSHDALPQWYNRSVLFDLSRWNEYRFLYGTVRSYHPTDAHQVFIQLYDVNAKSYVTMATIDKEAADDDFTIFTITIPSGFSTDMISIYSTCSEQDAELEVADGIIMHTDNPPTVPHDPSPSNGAIDVPVQNVYLNWTGGDPDRRDNVTYEIYLAYDDPDLSGHLYTTIGPYPPTQTQLSYQIPVQLLDYKTYYWKIVANDTYDILITSSATWHFTTKLPPLEVYVDDDYDEDTPGWGDTRFATIQDGIYRVREKGNVHVYNGTYVGANIPKSFNLIGNSTADTFIDGSGTGFNVGSYAGFVNISGFTLRNCTYGIRIYSDHVQVFDNTLFNIYEIGIDIDGDYCSIHDNDITNCDYSGIRMYPSSSSYIFNNTIKYVGDDDTGYGIELYYSSENNISGNTIQYIDKHGIMLYESPGNELYDNTVTYCDDTCIRLFWNSNECVIRKNYVAGSSQEVPSLITISSERNTIDQNTVNGGFSGSENGIYILESYNNLTSNKVYNTEKGISLWWHVQNITIVDNKAYDNTYGIYLDYVSTNINITQNKLHNPSDPASNTQIYGIYLYCSDYVNITSNAAQHNDYAYYLNSSDYNNIIDNTALATSKYAIYLESSARNTVETNELKSCNTGGIISSGYANYNRIYHNWINSTYGATGITLSNAYQNEITYNELNNNVKGIQITTGGDNIIQHNTIDGVSYAAEPIGISLETNGGYCYYNNVSYNTIKNNRVGVYLNGNLWHNEIHGNTLDSNDNSQYSSDDYAIHVFEVVNTNNITSNTIIGYMQSHGLLLESSKNLYVANNDFTDTGITIQGDFLSHWSSHTIKDNTANNKNISFYKNMNNFIVPTSNVSQVILVNCDFATINNTVFDTRVDIPIQLSYCNYNNITNNTLSTDPINTNDYGILLHKCIGNNISNNQLQFYAYDGIVLKNDSTDNYLSRNIVKDCGRVGIKITDSDTNIVANNLNISDNNLAGIGVFNSRNCKIANNQNIFSNFKGILLRDIYENPISNYNLISNNDVIYNGVGIKAEYCLQQNITRNFVLGQKDVDQIGIWLESSNDCTVFYNNVTDKLTVGIRTTLSDLDPSKPNLIYYNNLFDNGMPDQVEDDGIGVNNTWNDTYGTYPSAIKGGNHFNDFTQPDTMYGSGQNQVGSDGIVDVPNPIRDPSHQIQTNQDQYPHVQPLNFTYGTGIPFGPGVIDIPDKWQIINTGLIFPWFGQSDNFVYGGSAAQSSPVPTGESSWLKTTVDGPGSLSFFWSVNSIPGEGFLSFSIDGEKQEEITGEIPWYDLNYELGSGIHELEWTYEKQEYQGGPIVHLEEDFEEGFPPAGWTIDGIGPWEQVHVGERPDREPEGAEGFYAIADSDWNPGPFDVHLRSPSMGLSQATGIVTLECGVNFHRLQYGFAEIRILSDQVIQDVLEHWDYDSYGGINIPLDVAAYPNPSDIQIEFYYTTGPEEMQGWLSVDNVLITEQERKGGRQDFDCGWVDWVQWIGNVETPRDPVPVYGTFDVTVNPTLEWQCGDPDVGDTVTYEIYFGPEENPPLVDTIGPYSWDETLISWMPDELYYGIQYHWKIKAIDNHGNTAEGPVWTFTTTEKYSHVALWPMDEGSGTDVYDSTPYGNDGVITGATWTSGYYGSALYFDAGDYVTVPDSESVDITVPFSISAWINAENYGSYNCIVDKHEYSSGLSYGYTFYLNDGKLLFTLYCGENGDRNVFGSTDIRNQGWHHVKAEWDGKYVRVYLDGVIEGENAWSYPPASTTNDLGIGRRLDGHGGYLDFKGTIDEIHITRNDPPEVPTNPNPIQGEINVLISSSLSWDCDDYNYEDILTYDVYLEANDPTPDQLVSDDQIGTSFDPIADLEYNTTYYWRIVAKDTPGSSTVGPIWNFTTEIGEPNNSPYEPNNPNPENGAVDQSIETDLSWSGGDPDGDPVVYDVYFEENDPTPDIILSYNQSETSYILDDLNYDTTYYWKIVAKDDLDAIKVGPIWHFSTESEIIPTIVYVDDDYDESTPGWGYDHFDKIQEGIDAVMQYGMVQVYNGIYLENIVINKTIELAGEDNINTIINGNGYDNVLTIQVDYVNISEFSIVGGGSYSGIYLQSSNNAHLTNIIVTNNQNGILLDSSSNNEIFDINASYNDDDGIDVWHNSDYNIITYNEFMENGASVFINGSIHNTVDHNLVMDSTAFGIQTYNYAEYNTISNNTIIRTRDDLYGAIAGDAICLFDNSYNNIIENNNVSENKRGITLRNSEENTVRNNNIKDHAEQGIRIYQNSDNNILYHNNLMNNSPNAFDNRTNIWDDDYPSGGNYWDDYMGEDLYHGPNQDILGSDNIGDTPYNISGGSNQDNYPLMNPWGEVGFVLNLADFPMYQAEEPFNEMCGSAVAQMTLNYIWWNSSIDPLPPMLFDDQSWLYARGHENNSNPDLPYLDTQGLWKIIQGYKPEPYSEYGYNFNKYSTEDANEALKRICLWINYTIGSVGGYKEGHPLHVPSVVPAYGNYSNWMAIRGMHTDRPAYPMPDELTVYGFWVNDPYPASLGGIGENSYKTLGQWLSTYYQPLDTEDIYNGKYVTIIEPPEGDYSWNLYNGISPARFEQSSGKTLDGKISSQQESTVTRETIIRAAIDGVLDQLIPYDSDFAELFEKTTPGDPIFVENKDGNDYYAIPFNLKSQLQPFGKVKSIDTMPKKTVIAVLIDATDGHFKEASWVKEPVSYLPLTKSQAKQAIIDFLPEILEHELPSDFTLDLVFRKSSPYYPEWHTIIQNYEIFVSQDGSIDYIIIK